MPSTVPSLSVAPTFGFFNALGEGTVTLAAMRSTASSHPPACSDTLAGWHSFLRRRLQNLMAPLPSKRQI